MSAPGSIALSRACAMFGVVMQLALVASGLSVSSARAQHESRDTINSIRGRAKKPSAKRAAAAPAHKKRPPTRGEPRHTPQKLAVRAAKTAVSKPPLKAVTPPTPAPTDVARGLVAWWRCEGNAIDTAGNHNGTIVGGVGPSPGVVGQGLLFDGRYAAVNIPDADEFRLTGSLTVCAWVSIASLPVEGYRQVLFRGDNRGGLDPFFLAISPHGKAKFQITDAANHMDSVEADVSLGAFVHLAATLDGSTGTMRLYVNGKPAAENRTSLRPLGELDPRERPGLAIGNTQDLNAYNQPFHGIIDEVRIYNRALTPAEIEIVNKHR